MLDETSSQVARRMELEAACKPEVEGGNKA